MNPTSSNIITWLQTFPPNTEIVVRQGFTTDMRLFAGNETKEEDLKNDSLWFKMNYLDS